MGEIRAMMTSTEKHHPNNENVPKKLYRDGEKGIVSPQNEMCLEKAGKTEKE